MRQLASRGTLVLLAHPEHGPLLSRGPQGRAEWRWVLTCAAPLALQALGPESDWMDESQGPLARLNNGAAND